MKIGSGIAVAGIWIGAGMMSFSKLAESGSAWFIPAIVWIIGGAITGTIIVVSYIDATDAIALEKESKRM